MGFRRSLWPARCVLTAAIVFGLVTAVGPVAHADGAPEPAQPGSSPRAGTVPTNVRMVNESVVLWIEAAEVDTLLRPGAQVAARVEADFTMRNLGERTESLELWFPIYTGYELPAGQRGTTEPPELAIDGDFAAFMDGTPAAVERREVVEPVATPGSRKAYGTYAVWNGTFPSGRDVAMRVRYTARPTVYGPLSTFAYVLDTGAGWRDTIGAASVTFRLPYDVDDVNTVLASEGIYDTLRPRPAGYAISGADVTWRLADLEPEESDNPRLTVLAPGIWRRILDAREVAERDPRSVQAQTSLADALAQGVLYGSAMGVVWAGGDGRELWRQADAAYRRALDLAPDSLDVHLRYLDMLYGDCVICDATNAPPHFLTTLDHALEVAPANPTLLYYDSRLEAGGTANAAYFATATQEASLAIRPELPGPSPSAAAPVSTAASVATASRRPATPTPWARPNPTPGVPSGTQNARSVWRSRAPLQAIGIVLLIAVGLAAWADRRRRQPTPSIDRGEPKDSRREPPSADAPDGL